MLRLDFSGARNRSEGRLSSELSRYATARSSTILWLALIALVVVLLCAPFFRFLFFLGDEGTLLRDAELVLQGKRIYEDFFQFLPPGVDVVTAIWFSITGVSFGSARSLAVLIILGTACFTFLACRQASKNPRLAAMLAIGWAMMSSYPWMQISHHWFSALLSVVSAWAALANLNQPQSQLRGPMIAGMAAGGMATFVPHDGALVILAAMTAFLRRNALKLTTYLLGCAVAPAGMFAYLLGQHTFVAAFDEVIRFVATRYSSINGVPFGYQAQTLHRPLIFIFPLTAFLALIISILDWPDFFFDRRSWLCAALAMAGFIGCYPRPDFIHISYSVPLALPLLALSATRLTQSWRPVYRYAAAALIVVLCAPSVRQFQWRVRQALNAETVSTPRGEVRLFGPLIVQGSVAELLASIAETPPNDAYFFYPYDAMLPFLSGRKHVSRYDLFAPWYTTAAQYQEACRSVIRDAPWVVVDRLWTDNKQWKQSFPSIPGEKPKETVVFENALDNAYELVSTAGNFELRRRRASVSNSACDSIAN